MTGSNIEINQTEKKVEKSSASSTKLENEQSSSNPSEEDLTENINNESEEETFITEKFIKEHNENLEKRVQYLKDTMEALREQLNAEKSKWKKELEEFNQIHSAEKENSLVWNNFEKSADTSKNFSTSDYQSQLSIQNTAFNKFQAEQKASLWRSIAMAEYKRRLLEVENMCNLELIRVKQNVQSLQPLQKIISRWGDQIDETKDYQILKTKDSEDMISTKSTTTIATENEDLSENTNKESFNKSEDDKNLEKETTACVTPRNKIYNEFADVCAKMQTFMLNLPTIKIPNDSSTTTAQSAVWCSAYSLN